MRRFRRWLLVGDSITVGMRESLGATLARAGRYGTIEANIGDSVDEWVIADDLERLRRQGAWDVVVFLLGTLAFLFGTLGGGVLGLLTLGVIWLFSSGEEAPSPAGPAAPVAANLPAGETPRTETAPAAPTPAQSPAKPGK